MPTVELTEITGPSNALSSPNVDLEQTINGIYQGTDGGPSAKVRAFLAKRPGVAPFALISDAPIRGLFELNDRAFGVAGSVFFEFFDNGSVTEYPSVVIEDDAAHSPVTFISNGTAGFQLAFTASLYGYVFDLLTNTLSLIADSDFPQGEAKMLEFMDGYGIVLINDSRRFQISALEDFTDWDALDVAERSIASDNIVFIKRIHRDLILGGSQTSESWYDSGDPLFPFQPSQGVLIEQGACAGFATSRCDDTLIWPVKDERGQGVVSRLQGYTNVRTTTYAIDQFLQNCFNINTSVSFSFQMFGHLYYGLYNEDFSNSLGSFTLVYDVTENKWLQWGQWNSTTCLYEPFIGKYHCFAFQKHIFGSRSNGWLYDMSTAYLDDTIAA